MERIRFNPKIVKNILSKYISSKWSDVYNIIYKPTLGCVCMFFCLLRLEYPLMFWIYTFGNNILKATDLTHKQKINNIISILLLQLRRSIYYIRLLLLQIRVINILYDLFLSVFIFIRINCYCLLMALVTRWKVSKTYLAYINEIKNVEINLTPEVNYYCLFLFLKYKIRWNKKGVYLFYFYIKPPQLWILVLFLKVF